MRQKKEKSKPVKEKAQKQKKPKKRGPIYRLLHRKEAAEYLEKQARKKFLDMIAPTAIRFEQGEFVCGNTHRCVWVLRE